MAACFLSYLSSLSMRMQPPMISLSSGTLTLEKLSGLIPCEDEKEV